MLWPVVGHSWRALRGSRWVFLGVWGAVGVAAIGQRWVERALAGEPNDVRAIGIDAWLVVLWAAATPAFFAAARRFPVRGAEAWRHAMLHGAIAGAFIVATNVVIRLPLLWLPGTTVLAAARDLGTGLVRFGPTAILVYAAIVGIGHVAAPADTPVPARSYPERIAVREWNRDRIVRTDDVEWVESDDNYVIVQVAGRTFKGRGRISDLETQLDPSRFVRIHRSAIVSLRSVREVQPVAKGDLAVMMNDGKLLRVARTRKAEVEARLKS